MQSLNSPTGDSILVSKQFVPNHVYYKIPISRVNATSADIAALPFEKPGYLYTFPLFNTTIQESGTVCLIWSTQPRTSLVNGATDSTYTSADAEKYGFPSTSPTMNGDFNDSSFGCQPESSSNVLDIQSIFGNPPDILFNSMLRDIILSGFFVVLYAHPDSKAELSDYQIGQLDVPSSLISTQQSDLLKRQKFISTSHATEQTGPVIGGNHLVSLARIPGLGGCVSPTVQLADLYSAHSVSPFKSSSKDVGATAPASWNHLASPPLPLNMTISSPSTETGSFLPHTYPAALSPPAVMETMIAPNPAFISPINMSHNTARILSPDQIESFNPQNRIFSQSPATMMSSSTLVPGNLSQFDSFPCEQDLRSHQDQLCPKPPTTIESAMTAPENPSQLFSCTALRKCCPDDHSLICQCISIVEPTTRDQVSQYSLDSINSWKLHAPRHVHVINPLYLTNAEQPTTELLPHHSESRRLTEDVPEEKKNVTSIPTIAEHGVLLPASVLFPNHTNQPQSMMSDDIHKDEEGSVTPRQLSYRTTQSQQSTPQQVYFAGSFANGFRPLDKQVFNSTNHHDGESPTPFFVPTGAKIGPNNAHLLDSDDSSVFSEGSSTPQMIPTLIKQLDYFSLTPSLDGSLPTPQLTSTQQAMPMPQFPSIHCREADDENQNRPMDVEPIKRKSTSITSLATVNSSSSHRPHQHHHHRKPSGSTAYSGSTGSSFNQGPSIAASIRSKTARRIRTKEKLQPPPERESVYYTVTEYTIAKPQPTTPTVVDIDELGPPQSILIIGGIKYGLHGDIIVNYKTCTKVDRRTRDGKALYERIKQYLHESEEKDRSPRKPQQRIVSVSTSNYREQIEQALQDDSLPPLSSATSNVKSKRHDTDLRRYDSSDRDDDEKIQDYKY